jgi:hypothetical protein
MTPAGSIFGARWYTFRGAESCRRRPRCETRARRRSAQVSAPVRRRCPPPFGAGVRPRSAQVSAPVRRGSPTPPSGLTGGLSALSNSSLARFDVAALGSCPQCARQIGPYVFESHGLFRPFRARRKVVDAVPQGVALGWFVAAPFGAAGERRKTKIGASGQCLRSIAQLISRHASASPRRSRSRLRSLARSSRARPCTHVHGRWGTVSFRSFDWRLPTALARRASCSDGPGGARTGRRNR